MTSAKDRPASSTGGYQEERHGRGFIAFASILLFVIGFSPKRQRPAGYTEPGLPLRHIPTPF